MRKQIAAALSICMIASGTPGALAAGDTFSDVPDSHWAYEYVEKAAANGLVQGIGNGLYEVDGTVSNAEWAAMVSNLLLKEDVEAYRSSITSELKWWEPSVSVSFLSGYLAETELANSREQNEAPQWIETDVLSGISRYDMAQVIFNIAKKRDWPKPDGSTEAAKIADWYGIPGYYREAVDYCFNEGFVTGVDSNGTFAGSDTMTRGAAAVVLCRLLDAKNGAHAFIPSGSGESGLSAAALTVADRLTVTKSAEDLLYNKFYIAVTGDAIPGKLASGQEITEANILAMLTEIEAIFPDGTSSAGDGSTGDHYYYDHSGAIPYGGGCLAWAGMVADLLYGRGASCTTHTDLTAAKSGDIIHLLNSSTGREHWVVVMGTDSDSEGYARFAACESNVDGKVRFNAARYVQSTLTMYPNSTVYCFY